MGTHRPALRRSPRQRSKLKELVDRLEARRLFAIINVQDYGANPNDNNDDRSAIVNAINHSNDGDTIYFPGATVAGGAYRISQEISGNTGGVTKPLGRGRIYKGDTTFTTNDQPHATVEEGYSVQDRSILKSTGTDGNKKNAIFHFREGNPNPDTFNVKFTNLSFDGRGIFMSRDNNQKVEGVIIDNNHFILRGGGNNNNVQFTTGMRNSFITNNIFWCGGDTGLMGYNFDHLIIANNWFVNPPGERGNEGCHIFGFGGATDHDLTIEQNYFANLGRMGIEYQYNGSAVVVQDNWYEKPWNENNTDQFAYSIVADVSQGTITTRNTAIMPIKQAGNPNYVKIVFELGGKDLNCYDNYTFGGNHVAAVNGYKATGTVHDNHFELYAQQPSNNNGASVTFSNNDAGTDWPSFNPDNRIVGSSAPIRYRPLTNHRYGESGPVVVNTMDYYYETLPNTVSISFNRNVQASLSSSDLVLHRLDSNGVVLETVPVTFSNYDTPTDTATFTLNGGSILPDGNYRATLIAAGVSEGGGNHLATDAVLDFFFLPGDADHDRDVDVNDVQILANNYGGTGKTFSQGDFNYNGTVDSTDLGILSARWGQHLEPPPPPEAPIRPTNFAGIAVSPTEIDVTWTDQAINEDGYRIEQDMGGGNFQTILTLGANTTSAQITGLDPATPSYTFRVVAFRGSGQNELDSISSSATITSFDSGKPATPTNLVGTTIGLNRVDLSWTDNANNETAYRVERLAEDGVTWVLIDTLAADTTTYSMTSLASDHTFSFRVVAYNALATKFSNYSNIATVQTPIGDPTSTTPPPTSKRTRPALVYGGSTGGSVSPPVTSAS